MRIAKTLACFLAILILSTPAWAQRPRGDQGMGQQMDPEKAQVIWTWQAKDVVKQLTLDDAQIEKLVEAYVESRKRLNKALESMRPEGDEGGDRPRGGNTGIFRQVVEEERAGLESALGEVLTDEQVDTAMASLGSYNRQWDLMVGAVVGFELGEDATYKALVPVREYVIGFSTLRASGDRQAMRDRMEELRENLVTGLKPILSEAQLEEFGEMTTWRRRGPGGGDRQRGGDRPRGGDEPTVSGAQIGEPAPAFALNDSNGKAHSLSDYAGKIVVLQWINPDCPICTRVSKSGRVTAMRAELDRIDDSIVHVTINSTHYMEPEKGAEYLASHGIDAPVLIDQDGIVGKLYGAKTTPHMFVIDADGVLRYRGAIDDDQGGRKAADATNYVVLAVQQIASGETVSPDMTQSYGCSVKYAR